MTLGFAFCVSFLYTFHSPSISLALSGINLLLLCVVWLFRRPSVGLRKTPATHLWPHFTSFHISHPCITAAKRTAKHKRISCLPSAAPVFLSSRLVCTLFAPSFLFLSRVYTAIQSGFRLLMLTTWLLRLIIAYPSPRRFHTRVELTTERETKTRRSFIYFFGNVISHSPRAILYHFMELTSIRADGTEVLRTFEWFWMKTTEY